MKILAIAADINPKRLGGAESHFVEVLKRIAPKIESAVVLAGPNLRHSPDPSNVTFQLVNYPRIPNFFGLLYILFATPIALFQTVKFCPDLIWATLDYPQAQVGVLVKIFTGTPLYVTSQNPQLAKEELVVKGKLFQFLQKPFAGLVSVLVSFALGKADIVASVSNYSANLARKLGAKKVIVIPNGVDLQKFNISIHHKELHQPLKIVTTSSLIPRNGIDVLIKACELLPKEIDWQLTIAGDGPQRDELEKLVGELKINARVQFLGRVENTKIPQLLRKSTLFVRPSRFEGFGSSFIEAMACGVPVIGTPTGGITDFLKDGETGLLVPVDDPKALAETIQKIAIDSKIFERLVINGRRLVETRYNWSAISEKVFQEMEKCYAQRYQS